MAEGSSPLGVGHSITLTRTFNAPIGLVFDCFTKAEHLTKWWGPHGFSAPTVRADARPAGELYIDMQGPNLYNNPSEGEYIEVDRPHRVVFTVKAFKQPDGSYSLSNLNEVTFSEREGRTTVVLKATVQRATPELAGALSGMKAGWGQSLEKLGDLVGGGGKLDLEVRDRQIILQRAFDAPIDLVWAALTDPDHFKRWWFHKGEMTVAVQMDVRVGGRYRIDQTGPDGVPHAFWGDYVEVEPPHRLVQTQGFDAYEAVPVTTTLVAEWGRTLLTRTMDFPSNAYRDGMLGSSYEAATAENYDRMAAVLSDLQGKA